MKRPKFTDEARYPNGYIKSNETNVSKTFARVRKELEAQKRVVPFQRKKA